MKRIFTLCFAVFVLAGCSTAIRPQQLFEDVKELSSDRYKGRKTGTSGSKMAAEYIIKRFREVGLNPYDGNFKISFEFKNASGKLINGTNLVGYIPGRKTDAIVISAHYDHIGVIKGKIYNGADDNASGVGALLAIAIHFSKNPPEHTLIFASFDAEEEGLQGAKAFVEKPPVNLSHIKMNINMDMISRSKKNELYVAGTYHHPVLKAHVVHTNPQIKLLLGHDDPRDEAANWTNLSDHGAFYAKKIPFLYFGVEDHADYHKPTDDFDRIDREFYKHAVDAILEIITNIDKSITIQKVFKDKLIMKD